MTRPDGREENEITRYSAWMRRLPAPLDSSNYNCTDADGFWFAFREGWYILKEVKTRSAMPRMAQVDGLAVVAQHLWLGSRIGESLATRRGERPVEFRGAYLIRFSGDTPDDSSSIQVAPFLKEDGSWDEGEPWDDVFVEVDREGYLDFLRTGLLT